MTPALTSAPRSRVGRVCAHAALVPARRVLLGAAPDALQQAPGLCPRAAPQRLARPQSRARPQRLAHLGVIDQTQCFQAVFAAALASSRAAVRASAMVRRATRRERWSMMPRAAAALTRSGGAK
eukprot:1232731-Rhodomonas_salina.3